MDKHPADNPPVAREAKLRSARRPATLGITQHRQFTKVSPHKDLHWAHFWRAHGLGRRPLPVPCWRPPVLFVRRPCRSLWRLFALIPGPGAAAVPQRVLLRRLQRGAWLPPSLLIVCSRAIAFCSFGSGAPILPSRPLKNVERLRTQMGLLCMPADGAWR